MVKLPTASSASFVLRFLETMCRHLQCDNLFSSQPFSHYTVYDRTKSGKTRLSSAGRLLPESLYRPSRLYCLFGGESKAW